LSKLPEKDPAPADDAATGEPRPGRARKLWRIVISLPLPVLAGALGRFVYVRMYPKDAPP
jgi:hypothetical protein